VQGLRPRYAWKKVYQVDSVYMKNIDSISLRQRCNCKKNEEPMIMMMRMMIIQHYSNDPVENVLKETMEKVVAAAVMTFHSSFSLFN
jgi:hypothetical protein